MIYIKKQPEPHSLTEYKKQSNAYYDGFRNKNDIREKLLEEQGYLCAYCMRRIPNIDSCTIEHYKPQQLCSASEALDYNNMLGVCKINRNTRKQFQTCDSHRGSVPLVVNPLNAVSVSRIAYDERTGIIYSENKQINHDLNDTLNLNCAESRLQINRRASLEAFKQYLTKHKSNGTWHQQFLFKFCEMYCSKDSNNQYREYLGIILWYINKRIKHIGK